MPSILLLMLVCVPSYNEDGIGVDGGIVQSSCRSLIVDTLPISKQQLGSAWGKHIPCIGFKTVAEPPKQVEWWPLVILLATAWGQ